MTNKIILSALAATFLSTAANAAINEVSQGQKDNIVKACEVNEIERLCSGIHAGVVYSVVNGQFVELGRSTDFAGKTKDSIKESVTKTIVETVVVPEVRTIVETKIETVEVLKTEIVERIVEVSKAGDLAEIARLGAALETAETKVDELESLRSDLYGFIDGVGGNAKKKGLDQRFETVGAGYSANSHNGWAYVDAIFAAGADSRDAEIATLNAKLESIANVADQADADAANYAYYENDANIFAESGVGNFRVTEIRSNIYQHQIASWYGSEEAFLAANPTARVNGTDFYGNVRYSYVTDTITFLNHTSTPELRESVRDLITDGALMSSIEAAVEAAYEIGYEQGYEAGYEAGYNQGFADGVASVKSAL